MVCFYAESIQEEDSMPEPPMFPVKQLAQGFWGVACALFCCITRAKDQTDSHSLGHSVRLNTETEREISYCEIRYISLGRFHSK